MMEKRKKRGEDAANVYPKSLLSQTKQTPICSRFFARITGDTFRQLFLEIRTISLDLFLNILKMWRKVECSGQKRFKVGQARRM